MSLFRRNFRILENKTVTADPVYQIEQAIVQDFHHGLKQEKKFTLDILKITGIAIFFSYLYKKMTSGIKEFIFLDNNRMVFNKLVKYINGLGMFMKVNLGIMMTMSMFMFIKDFVIKEYFYKLPEERLLEAKLDIKVYY